MEMLNSVQFLKDELNLRVDHIIQNVIKYTKEQSETAKIWSVE